MQTELTTTPHPHDPHADDLTWSQSEDVLRYFAPPSHKLHFHRESLTYVLIFDGDRILAWGLERPTWDAYEDALRVANLWPSPSMCPPPPRFAAVGASVMLGAEQIATTRGNNMAKRIANALNWYKPGRRGH